MTDATTSRRFAVALSFPGEHRTFVEQVAEHLSTTFTPERVLYDKYHEEELARLDLNLYLPALYRKESELIVVCLCPEYAAKLWCRLEWRHISQLIATVDAKRIMFLSFGNPGDLSELGILGGDGYINVDSLTPQTVAEKIRKRLNLNLGIAPAAPTTSIPADISRIVKYAPAELIGREAEAAATVTPFEVRQVKSNFPATTTEKEILEEQKEELSHSFFDKLHIRTVAVVVSILFLIVTGGFVWWHYSQPPGTSIPEEPKLSDDEKCIAPVVNEEVLRYSLERAKKNGFKFVFSSKSPGYLYILAPMLGAENNQWVYLVNDPNQHSPVSSNQVNPMKNWSFPPDDEGFTVVKGKPTKFTLIWSEGRSESSKIFSDLTLHPLNKAEMPKIFSDLTLGTLNKRVVVMFTLNNLA